MIEVNDTDYPAKCIIYTGEDAEKRLVVIGESINIDKALTEARAQLDSKQKIATVSALGEWEDSVSLMLGTEEHGKRQYTIVEFAELPPDEKILAAIYLYNYQKTLFKGSIKSLIGVETEVTR